MSEHKNLSEQEQRARVHVSSGDLLLSDAHMLLRLLDAERARTERVVEVRRAMGHAAEAWYEVEPKVGERLQHFSDKFAAALADSNPQ